MKRTLPGGEIGAAVERVVQRAVGIGVKRVEGEVAAAGVFEPVVGEGHDRAAPVGLDVAAQGRELEIRELAIAVTVPCFRPVGTTLIPAASSARITASGGLSTARSRSIDARSSTASRTQPPTKRAAMPAAFSAANNRCVGASAIQAGASIFPAAIMVRTDHRIPGPG